MAVVEFIFDLKSPSWLTGNTNVPKLGEPIFLSNGKYALGDGVTQVQSLPLYGGVSTAPVWGAITGILSNQTDLQNALNAKYDASNPSGYITSSALTPYLTSANAALTYHPLNGNTTNSNYQILNSATSYFNFKEISSGFAGLYFNTASQSTTNYTYGGDGVYAVINAPLLSVIFRSANTTWASGTAFLTNASGGQFSLLSLTSLGNPANSQVQKFISNGASIQWDSGTTSVQYENVFTSPTYSGISATTITNFGNVTSDFAIASTNMSIINNAAFYNPTRVLTSSTTNGYGGLFNAPSGATNNWAAGFIGNVTVFDGYFLNARIKPRITTITSSATPTINTDNCDAVTITALATAITSMTTNLSGTPNNFDKLTFRIKDNGTARAITWGASFEPKGVALPTTTVISKVLTVGFIYDSVTSKWGCVSSAQEI